mgnify:CR=1 FL=1
MPITVPTPREYSHMNERQKRQAQRNLKAVATMLKLPTFVAIDPVVRQAQAWRYVYGDNPNALNNLHTAVEALRGAQHG